MEEAKQDPPPYSATLSEMRSALESQAKQLLELETRGKMKMTPILPVASTEIQANHGLGAQLSRLMEEAREIEETLQAARGSCIFRISWMSFDFLIGQSRFLSAAMLQWLWPSWKTKVTDLACGTLMCGNSG